MSNIIIYSTNVCPYCVRAKSLLQRKNVKFTEIKITDDETREEMIKKSDGRKSVPQIFIDDKHIGGYDDLHALDLSGKLDDLLK